MDTTPILDRAPKDQCPEVSTNPGAVPDEKGSNWKSTAFATAKLLLRGVRDGADAFGPLKSVAGGLCFILENCEVRPVMCILCMMLTSSSAYKGKHSSNRIAGTPNRSTSWTALQAHSRGGGQGAREERETGRVSLFSTKPRFESDKLWSSGS